MGCQATGPKWAAENAVAPKSHVKYIFDSNLEAYNFPVMAVMASTSGHHGNS